MAVDLEMFKLEDLCRLCLQGPGSIDIFETYHLSQHIYSCTGVKVSLTDKLPRKVCNYCFDIIKSANHLRIIASQNDTHLQNLRKNTNYFSNDLAIQTDKEDIKDRMDSEENVLIKKEITTTINESQTNYEITNNEQSPPCKVIKVRTDLFHQPETEDTVAADVKNTSLLSAHDRHIEDDIKFTCDVCFKTFETSKKLYLHKRLHNKTRACIVAGCEKKFATKSDLEKHIRTHTGEKPFVCSICYKSFTQGGTLRVHLESVHGMCKVEREEVIISDVFRTE